MKITQTKRGWLVEPETVSEKAHLRYLLHALSAQTPQGTLLDDAEQPANLAAPPPVSVAAPARSAAPGVSHYWVLRTVRGIVGFLLIVNIAGTINLHNYQYMSRTEAMAVFASSCALVAILLMFFIGLKSLINFFHIRKHGCPHPSLTKWWNL